MSDTVTVTEPTTPESRRRKALSIATLAGVSLVGVIAIALMSWASPDSVTEPMARAQAFFEYVVISALGFFTGAAVPDRR